MIGAAVELVARLAVRGVLLVGLACCAVVAAVVWGLLALTRPRRRRVW